MPSLSIAKTLLIRDWKSQSLRLLAIVLVLMTAIVFTVTSLSTSISEYVDLQTRVFLGADRVLKSPREIDAQWIEKAHQNGIQTSASMEFQSMAFFGDAMQLSSVKAVASNYPLSGTIRLLKMISDKSQELEYDQAPLMGEVWLDRRMEQALGVTLGDRIDLGNGSLRVTAWIVNERDKGISFANLYPRALMNLNDVPKLGVVQLGSRVNHGQYFLGSKESLSHYGKWLNSRLNSSMRWLSRDQQQNSTQAILLRAERFFLLASALVVLLAGIALSMCGRLYAQKQLQNIFVLKSLGMKRYQLIQVYCLMLTVLTLMSALLGISLGLAAHQAVLFFLEKILGDSLGFPPVSHAFLSLFLVSYCLFAFIMPSLIKVLVLSPLALQRLPEQVGKVRSFLLAMLGLIVFCALYTQQLLLSILVFVAMMLVALLSISLARVLFYIITSIPSRLSPAWKIAARNLNYDGLSRAVQIFSLGLCLALLLIISLIQHELLNDWQSQHKTTAPNVFLINIAKHDIGALQEFMASQQLQDAGLYPMVRGRLSMVNGVAVETLYDPDKLSSAGVKRELNLSESLLVPDGNEIVEGRWWLETMSSVEAGISLESGLAKRLNLVLNDNLSFRIGDQIISRRVSSIRTLDWMAMKPNFYVLFPPEQLMSFDTTYITSFNLPSGDVSALNQLSLTFPTIISVDIRQIQADVRIMIDRIAFAMQLLLASIMAMGILVILAALQSSLPARRRDAAILRALGAHSRTVWLSFVFEYVAMAMVAALIAIITAEVCMASLQYWLFDLPITLHPGFWLIAIFASVLLLSLTVYRSARSVSQMSPKRALQA